jgi:hypothetical protein
MPEMAERSLRSVCREKRERRKRGGCSEREMEARRELPPAKNGNKRRSIGEPGKWDDDDG